MREAGGSSGMFKVEIPEGKASRRFPIAA